MDNKKIDYQKAIREIERYAKMAAYNPEREKNSVKKHKHISDVQRQNILRIPEDIFKRCRKNH